MAKARLLQSVFLRRCWTGPFPSRDDRLLRELCAKIRFSGPLTVAQYMREVLSNPVSGYYSGRSSNPLREDFTTSPEISQMFGESIGVWVLNEWAKMGTPKPLQIVELGPGTGALAKDVLRTFESNLSPKVLPQILSLHLVECSPRLKEAQRVRLTNPINKTNEHVTPSRIPVHWHCTLSDVPEGFSIFIANEFFDALPVHQFIKNSSGYWREILVDIKNENKNELRFVMSRNQTPGISLISENEGRTELEICPDGDLLARELSERVIYNGGAALIVDYGYFGDRGLTLRGFKNHKIVEVLEDPGNADITASVDFKRLKENCKSDKTKVYGPVIQSKVLKALCIEQRMNELLSGQNEEVGAITKSQYMTLTDPEEMGGKFKFFCIFPKTMEEILRKFPPPGFE